HAAGVAVVTTTATTPAACGQRRLKENKSRRRVRFRTGSESHRTGDELVPGTREGAISDPGGLGEPTLCARLNRRHSRAVMTPQIPQAKMGAVIWKSKSWKSERNERPNSRGRANNATWML